MIWAGPKFPVTPVGKRIWILRIFDQRQLVEPLRIAFLEAVPLSQKHPPTNMRKQISLAHSGCVRDALLQNRFDLIDSVTEPLTRPGMNILHPRHRKILQANIDLPGIAILPTEQLRELPAGFGELARLNQIAPCGVVLTLALLRGGDPFEFGDLPGAIARRSHQVDELPNRKDKR